MCNFIKLEVFYMNQIRTKVLNGELKYDNTVILTYKIEYPEMIFSFYELGRNIFNRYNRNLAIELENYARNELYKSAIETYKYNKENGFPVMVYELVNAFDITYNDNFIVSLYMDKYEFTGGAHGNTIRSSQNWNLRTGRQLPLSYFYPNNPNYVVDILKSIISQIKENPENYFDNYCELVLENFNLDNYYVTAQDVVIYFQQYDIAPYSSGIPTFNIKR